MMNKQLCIDRFHYSFLPNGFYKNNVRRKISLSIINDTIVGDLDSVSSSSLEMINPSNTANVERKLSSFFRE